MSSNLRVGVIGGGIAGVTAAYLLGKRYDVTLIERNDYVGGHTNTIEVSEGDRIVPVDTGFIVCNPRTYTNFYELLREWGVSLRDSDMSFGFSCEHSGLGYVGPSVREFLRKPTNVFNPKLIRMLLEQRRFNRQARADLDRGDLDGLSLGEYVERVGASPFFVEHYLIPMASAVWSSPDAEMLRFPAATFVRFFENHGLLNLRDRPTWQTVVGGSYAYVEAFRSKFRGTVMTDAPVAGVCRADGKPRVRLVNGREMTFDVVVMAAHADESLAMLEEPSDEERDALSAWSYHRNTMQLHTDTSVMPRDRRVWASWNYHRGIDATPEKNVAITYWLNRLQGIRSTREYLVSLNATERVAPESVIYSTVYAHPAYTGRSIEAQRRVKQFNGARNTFFCGAYLRYGFHEDGVVSAVDVASRLGVTT